MLLLFMTARLGGKSDTRSRLRAATTLTGHLTTLPDLMLRLSASIATTPPSLTMPSGTSGGTPPRARPALVKPTVWPNGKCATYRRARGHYCIRLVSPLPSGAMPLHTIALAPTRNGLMVTLPLTPCVSRWKASGRTVSSPLGRVSILCVPLRLQEKTDLRSLLR